MNEAMEPPCVSMRFFARLESLRSGLPKGVLRHV